MPTKKQVVTLIRSNSNVDDQKFESQRQAVKKILSEHDLEPIAQFEFLGVSGNVICKTKDYQELLALLRLPEVVGMVVPTIDRWFRCGRLADIADLIKPFEETFGGKPKLVYCDLGALDLGNRKDLDTLLRANQYGSNSAK